MHTYMLLLRKITKTTAIAWLSFFLQPLSGQIFDLLKNLISPGTGVFSTSAHCDTLRGTFMVLRGLRP